MIMAGGRADPTDPLYAYTQGQPKAMLEMGGRPMIEQVIVALQGAQAVEEMVVVGLNAGTSLNTPRPVHHLPDQGSLIGNVLGGFRWMEERYPKAQALLISTSDIPLVTSDMIDSFIEMCRPYDHILYYPFATRQVMEKRFPGSNRTYTRIDGQQGAGGDMMVVQPAIANTNLELWEALTNARKYPWKVARAVGFGTLLKLLTRRLSTSYLQKTSTRLLGRPIKPVLIPYAEMAMDGDKPYQIDLLRAEMKQAN